MNAITDPNLIAELEGNTAPVGKPVTDPSLIQEIEKTEAPAIAEPAEPTQQRPSYIAHTPQFDIEIKETVYSVFGDSPQADKINKQIQNAYTLAATHDISPADAFDFHDILVNHHREPSIAEKATGSFKAGWGDIYSSIGGLMKRKGISPDIADEYLEFGEKLKLAYIPPTDMSEFTWRKTLDPEWLATTAVRSVPFTLSLVPAAIAGAYGGTFAAGAAGLGTFGTLVLGAIGGAALSRPIESAFESQGAFEEAKQKGMNDDEAEAAADRVFWDNMKLVGLDAAEFATAFLPMGKIAGKAVKRSLAMRVFAVTGKFGAVGAMEGLEERYQESAVMNATGEPVSMFDFSNPRLNEAGAAGAVFGIGLGGAGSVWNHFKDTIVIGLPEEMKKSVSEAKTPEAQIKALDAIANTPEGKQAIESTIKSLKDTAEGKGEVFKTELEKEQAQTSDTQDIDTDFESMVSGETDILDMMDKHLQEGTADETQTEQSEALKQKITEYEQDPEAVINSIAEKAETPEAAMPEIEAVASSVYAEGNNTEETFTARMQEVFGDLYEKFKDVIKVVWEKIKTIQPGMSIKDVSKGEYLKKQTDTPAFRAWFGDSKVIDEKGEPLVVYHGSKRADRIAQKGKFDPKRATSGPMQFFTEDSELGSSYSTNKQDTSLEHPDDYSGWFKFKGKGMRSSVSIDRAWWTLTQEKREEIKRNLYTTGYQDSENSDGPIVRDSQSIMGPDSIDYELRQAKGNALKAASEIWLNSGTLFNQEDQFMDVLSALGMDMKSVEYDSPWREQPAVIPVYLSIKNPIDTSNIPPSVVTALEQSGKRKRAKNAIGGNADMWDKNTISGSEWIKSLMEDIEKGTTYSWTRIPDWVTQTLKDMGYDGIKDVGGKQGGKKHAVYIPFFPTQIKSATGNSGAFDPNNPNILYSNPMFNPELIYNKLIKPSMQAVEKAMPHLERLSQKVYSEGMTDIKAFTGKMKEYLGDLYEKFKALMGDLFDKAKAFNESLGERGSFSLKSVVPTSKVKKQIRTETGQVKPSSLVREDQALVASLRKAEQAARAAYKAGDKEGVARESQKLKNIIARRKKIVAIRETLGLTDADMKKISKKNPLLMAQYEFKLYLDNVRLRAVELVEHNQAKAELLNVIFENRLKKVENYRKALDLPTLSKMTTDQLRGFADLLEPFADGDIFLTERELETVDRTDLKGIRTWREAKQKLAQELGVSFESLQAIKTDEFDKYRYDTALAEKNPFYRMMVTEATRKLLEAEARSLDIERKAFDLAKKSNKSRSRSIGDILIPSDVDIMAYLEASKEDKTDIAKTMTPEQLDYAHFMQEYFGQALEYLIKTEALGNGKENYFVHMRKTFLESWKDDGLKKALMNVYKNYQQDEAVFNILDQKTGEILPLEKFFQYALHRSGELDPTTNVTRAFLAYSKMFEKKVSLDELIPKIQIYAQSLTPSKLTPKGLEFDDSLKRFVYEYINNKKGRRIRWVGEQNGKVDLVISSIRVFTTMLDLGLNIPVGITSFVGEQVMNFQGLGSKAYIGGNKRAHTEKGKAILKQYENFTGKTLLEEFNEPDQQITDKLGAGLLGLFHQSAVTANKAYLLGSMTDAEYQAGEIDSKRLAEIKVEMGRWRVTGGNKSLVGSTVAGGAFIQYKTWAVPILRTLTNDISTVIKDIKNSKEGALSTKQAQDLKRAIGITSVILIVYAIAHDEDDKDKSFAAELKRKTLRESLTLVQGVSPQLWGSTPRVMTFLKDLGDNLTKLVMLEEYKTKEGLKGAAGLQRQFTPRAVKFLTNDDNNNTRR